MNQVKWHPQELIAEVDRLVAEKLEECGRVIADNARMIVPVDTGALQDSIDYELTDDNKSIHVGSNLDYSVFVELGTRKMSAQPYLQPALDGSRAEINTIFGHGE